MNFPTDEEYLEFIRTLDADELRLTCGNCGMFAFALYDVFKTGTLFKVGDFYHILLRHNEKLYDGEKIYNTIAELKNDRHWAHYFFNGYSEELIPDEEVYEEIVNETRNSKPKEFFEEIIKGYFNR